MAVSASPITVTPLHPYFAARVDGVELAGPLSDEAFRQISDAFNEHSVLVFHDQRLTDEQQMVFSRRFGPLETTIKSIGQEARLDPNLVDLSNLDPEDDASLMDWKDRRMVYQAGNQLWHSDSSFKPVPAQASLLSGREVPPVGGETEFVSMRHAYATLPDDLKRQVDGKIVVHSIIYSRSLIADALFDQDQADALPPVRHALVRANPANGRRSIYIGSHASHIEGLSVPEGRALLARLLEHTTRPDCVYQHRWQQWDLVIWDNRCVLHRGRPWDAGRHRRVMRRTTVAGEGPTADPPYADDEAKRVIAASVESHARERARPAP